MYHTIGALEYRSKENLPVSSSSISSVETVVGEVIPLVVVVVVVVNIDFVIAVVVVVGGNGKFVII